MKERVESLVESGEHVFLDICPRLSKVICWIVTFPFNEYHTPNAPVTETNNAINASNPICKLETSGS